MKLKDVKVNDHFEGKLLVSSVQQGKAVNGETYLTIVVQDNTKQLSCKLWSAKKEIIELIKPGIAFDFIIEINTYKNSLQGKILSIVPTTQDGLEELVLSSPIAKEELVSFISKCLSSINNVNLSSIVTTLFKRYENKFYEYQAAAKIHHAYVGGLATHTYEMLKLGVEVCKIFKEVNYDYLIAGIIIHDIGKIEEYQKPTVGDFTAKGKLIGHISIIDGELLSIGKELGLEDTEELLVLRHMILSHHGKKEFGSPVLPSTLESIVLNLIDDLDSKINLAVKELDEVKVGEFTSKIFALNETALYKHK